jgi:uncharacterized protein
MRMRGKVALVAVMVGALAVTAGCGGRRENTGTEGKAPSRLTIATGNTTGVYYQLGGGLAKLIGQNIDGTQATATETGASVQNVQGVVDGKYDVAFCLMDTASDAVNGKGSFSEKQDVEALLRLYPNYTQVVARKGSGISSIADMKGKRISTGSPNSGTEVIANRLLEAAGLDPKTDIKAQRLGLPESVDGMKDGTIDALFWSGGLPTGGIIDLTTELKGKTDFINLSAELPKLQAEYGDIYEAGSIPAKTYSQPADVSTIVVPNVLLVKKGFNDEMAGKLVKLIFDKKSDLVAVNAAAEGISLDTAKQSAPIPLNPGAEKALDELGAK